MFKDKVAVVTGGSRGIGFEITSQLIQNGASVAVVYMGSDEEGQKAIDALPEGTCKVYKCDVSDFNAVGDVINQILADFGKVDILVNNAGITRDKLVLQMSEKDFDDCVNVNLKGAFNCIKHLTKPFLKQRSGKIINMSSVVGLMGNAGQLNYSASKAGLIGLTKSASKEFASRGITCNAVAPGYIETEMTANLPEEVKEGFLQAIPLKRPGKPSDVAAAVLFFASDAANYITGQIIKVDGGLYI